MLKSYFSRTHIYRFIVSHFLNQEDRFIISRAAHVVWMGTKFECLPDVVVKSPKDPKEYRVIRLENGLTALLISDKGIPTKCTSTKSEKFEKTGEKLAAAALSIGVGSFSDPVDLPGLSHFLEHMVFMGSKKYPNENEFDEFIKKHGGYNNAFTECEYTAFYFEVEKSVLQKALDIFSGFFSCPLMKQDSVNREIKAVDSEFCMSKTNDMVRWEQILSSMAKPDHPMGKFMWGNLRSLKAIPKQKGIDSYARLKEFYKRKYSADYMKLVVQAMYPLDVLEDWVVNIFSAIPRNTLPRPCFSHLTDPFDTPSFNKIYKAIPSKNDNKLIITWSLPSQLVHYHSKPLQYLGFMVGHEGTGSVMAYLRNRMWAVDLEAGTGCSGYEHNSTQALFTVTVRLTDIGFEHVHNVITAILQHVDMLRREGPREWLFDEIKSIHDSDFKWMESENPVDNVEHLCAKMLKYPPAEYITGDLLYVKYEPQLIIDCLALLTPSRANYYILSKKYAQENICNLKETWFKTQYCVEDIPDELEQLWQNLPVEPELHLPAPNRFIATDFSLKPAVAPTEYPVAITDTSQSKLFFKQDTKFKLPKAHVSFLLISPAIKASATNLVMMELFVEILHHQLRETAYASSVASLSYHFQRQEHGLLIKVLGFNDKLLKLFQTLVDFMADFSVDDAVLSTMKKKIQKDLYNAVLKPTRLCKELRLAILRHNEKTSIDGMRVISNITVDMMMTFVKVMLQTVFVDGLIQGNLTPEEAKEFESYLLEKLQCRPILEDIPDTRVVSLDVGQMYCRTDNLNPNDENSVITNYYQLGPGSLRDYVINDLLTMRMEEPCFDILRTRLQLGYSVSCMNRITDGILGFSITVCSQAHKFSLDQLDSHIEDFLKEFDSLLQSKTEKDFETVRNSLITVKSCMDSNLQEEVSRNWDEIVERTYQFETLKRQVEELKTVTLDDLRAWFRRYMNSGCKKLSIQVEGHKSACQMETSMSDGHVSPDIEVKMEIVQNDIGAPNNEEENTDEEFSSSVVSSSDEEDGDEEEDEEIDEESEEEMDIADDYHVEELLLKTIEDKDIESVITDISKTQAKSHLYPISRIL